MTQKLARMLKKYKSGKVSMAGAINILKDLPYKDIGFARIDCHRNLRRGFPEVIFGQGKTTDQIIKIAKRLAADDGILLITRTNEKVYRPLKKLFSSAKFDKKSGVISYRKKPAQLKKGLLPI